MCIPAANLSIDPLPNERLELPIVRVPLLPSSLVALTERDVLFVHSLRQGAENVALQWLQVGQEAGNGFRTAAL